MSENILDVRLLHAAKPLNSIYDTSTTPPTLVTQGWSDVVTPPKKGEVCLEIQGTNPPLSYKIKIGDGTSSYLTLPYFGTTVNVGQGTSIVRVVNTDSVEGTPIPPELWFYKIALDKSDVAGVTTITPVIGDLYLKVKEGDKIDFDYKTENLTTPELTFNHETVTATTDAVAITDGGTFTAATTKDNYGHVTKLTTFTLPSIGTAVTSAIEALDKSNLDLVEWDSTNGVLTMYPIYETDGVIYKGSTASYTLDLSTYVGNVVHDVKINNTSILDNNNEANLAVDGTYNASTNKIATESTVSDAVDTAIGSLDAATVGGTDKVITTISETDGVISATAVNKTDVAPVQGVTTTDTGDSGIEITTSNNVKDVHHKTVVQDDTDTSSIIGDKDLPVITGINVDSYGHITGVTKDISSNLIAADIKAPVKQTDNTTWNHRITGGDISIGEDIAKIPVLKGNTIVWNQLVDSSTSSVTLTSGNKYYTVIGGIKSIQTGAGTAVSVTGGTDIVIDLTKMFGSGNEPSSVEEFEKLFHNSYYPYNEGELVSLNPTGINSTGFNQWDEEWERGAYSLTNGDKIVENTTIRCTNLIQVLPNTQYYCTNKTTARVTGTIAMFYDSNRVLITKIDGSRNYIGIGNTSFITPLSAKYMSMYTTSTTYNNDICINISDSVKNSTYEPYKQDTLDLSWIKDIKDTNDNQLFPYGLLKAGSVYDEVTESKAIKRITSRAYQSGDESDFTVITDGTTTYYPLTAPIEIDIYPAKNMSYLVNDLGTETQVPVNPVSTPITAPFVGTFEYKSNFKDTVIDLIDKVNNAANPVKGINNTDQTVGKIAVYDSERTTHSSNYSASNATIVEGATGNDIILPAVETIVNYVNTKLSSALTYKGTISEWADLPTSGQSTGDMYIADTTFTEGSTTYQAGDFFIWNGTDWDIVSGTTSVVNSNPTLSLDGSTYQVGTVDGIALQVTTPNLDYSSPTASGTSLEYIDSVSQSNGLISATKKSLPNASTTQAGVTSFVTDIHYSTDNEKTATAKQIWVECEKRNVQFVEAGVVPTGLPMTEDEFINTYAYGVKWVQGSSECTRVGNSSLHETMPIHNALRACVYQIVPQEVTVTETIDGVDYTLNYGAKREFRYWLDDDDWNKKADGTPSVLTGEDMTGIAIWHPKFYGKSFDGVIDGSTSYNSIYVSLVQYDNTWTEIKEGYVDFAKMQTVSSNGVNYARSFGNPDFSVDNPSTTEMTLSAINTWIQTQKDSTQSLVKSQVGMNRLTANQYAMNAGAHLMSLDEYKWIFCWLPVIECAAFTVEENTHFDWQDGSDTNIVMRDSLSNIPSWMYYGMYSTNYSAITRTCGWAAVPAGYTNKLGTHTGWIKMRLPNSGGTYDSKIASRWRGFEIQRNIWTNLMGVNPVQTNTSGTVDVYSTKNRALWNNDMPIDITDESASTHANIMPWDSRDAEEPEYTTLTGWEHKGIQKWNGYGTEFDLGSDGNPTYRTLGSSKPDCQYGVMSNANPCWFVVGGSAYYDSNGGPFDFNSRSTVDTAEDSVGFRCCWNIDEYNSVLN